MARWRPSRTAVGQYAQKMNEIEEFCEKNKIDHSASMDSYYFEVAGHCYRVSNHSVEASNAAAYDWTGQQVRELYHEEGRQGNTTYIHAGKTRIMEIYNDLMAGYELDGRGNRK